MDHDGRTADTGMLGSETENPESGRDSPRTTPESAATTSEGHPVATTDMSDADADRTSLGTYRTSNPQP
jgi:hypothetical protein